MMLAQWLRLDTPPHAVLATGLPLLAGGPRRLAVVGPKEPDAMPVGVLAGPA